MCVQNEWRFSIRLTGMVHFKPSCKFIINLVNVYVQVANSNHLDNNNNQYLFGSSLTSSLLKHTLVTQNLHKWASDSSDMNWQPENDECPPLPQPDEGRLTCSDGFKKKSVCQYECQRGFITSGKSKRRCKCDKDSGRCYRKYFKWTFRKLELSL